MLKKITWFTALIMLLAGSSGFKNSIVIPKKIIPAITQPDLYEELQLSELGLKKDIFEKGMNGWQQLKNKAQLENPDLLTIADLSQSCNSKRLYVIDLKKKKVEFNTLVSHGRNSGNEFARSFGNESESYKSSLGFYLTGVVYKGTHGVSMRLKGIENGINHLAEQRGIVMHGAWYVSETFIRRYGRLGRSQGCPAVPEEDCIPIVYSIKEGSCFFVFYPDSNYFNRSEFYN